MYLPLFLVADFFYLK